MNPRQRSGILVSQASSVQFSKRSSPFMGGSSAQKNTPAIIAAQLGTTTSNLRNYKHDGIGHEEKDAKMTLETKLY